MKQLMDHFGPHVIVALNDRVLVLVQVNNSDNENGNTVIQELLTPSLKEDENNKNANPPKKKKKQSNENKDKSDENAKVRSQVQAVSMTGYENYLICAVSRFNKSLSLYCIPLSSVSANTSTSITDAQTCMEGKVEAYLTYNLNKRSCSIAFTDLSTKSSSTKNIPIIVTADLTGDAFAYSTHFVDYFQQKKDDTSSTSISKSHKKRLLLGHTASMLTSVKIVKDLSLSSSDQKQQQRILTADRDEKIRISFFPQTFNIEHYLLGHTAFISCLDVSTNTNVSKCVSGSGDGTVRVWDYFQNKQLYQVSPLSRNVEKVSSPTSSKTSQQQSSSNANSNSSHYIPSSVAMSRDGRMIAIAWDSSSTVKILLFSENTQNTESNSMEVTHTFNIQCQKQPLSLCFILNDNDSKESLFILTSDSQNVLLQYTPDTNIASSTESTEVTLSSSSSSSQSLLLQTFTNTNNIEMPQTVMEYKNDNQTNNKPSLKMIKGSDPVGFPSNEENNDANKDSGTCGGGGGGGLIKKDSQNNQQPKWNNSIERKEKHRLKQAQRRKRKRNAKSGIHSEVNNDSDNGDENINNDDY